MNCERRRQSIRLKGFDYGQPGAYFVTICASNRECLFGEVVNGEMLTNECGSITQKSWEDLPHHYGHVVLDAFVVMPNHIHGIIVLVDEPTVVGAMVGAGLKPTVVGAGLKPAPTRRHGLPEIVRAFKTFSARRINEYRQSAGVPVWQRNYYEHVVRNDWTLDRIREYISSNPLRWQLDKENPLSRGKDEFDKWLTTSITLVGPGIYIAQR